MKVLFLTAALIAAFALVGVAQDQKVETTSKTKVTVKDGKEITVTGCIQRSPGGLFTLAHVAGRDGPLGSYFLVTDDEDDLADHVGHRVQIVGKAADQGTGKLTIETETAVKPEDGEKRSTEHKTEVKGDLVGMPYLGVKSVKMIASVCP